MIAQSVEKLLIKLSQELHMIVKLKLQGHTNAAIGENITRTEVTIERKRRLFRTVWWEAAA